MTFTKKSKLALGLIASLGVASFFGCSSALESDTLPGEVTISGLAQVQQAKPSDPPATLVETDWLIETGFSYDKPFIVVNFFDGATGNLLFSSEGDPEPFGYTYTPATGAGSFTGDNYQGTFTARSDGVTMDVTINDIGTFVAALIDAKRGNMDGTVWETEATPRDIYSSLDFEGDVIQTVFGDGTFPEYELLFYDGVSAGLTEDMGLFYLDYDASGVLTVVFPKFYNYHPAPVVFTPSDEVLDSLENTVWFASGISETATFTDRGQAVFSGSAWADTVPYVYDGKQAGGAGNRPYTRGEPGSFRVAEVGKDQFTLTFFNWLNSGNMVTFAKQ
jgi:hypothetical protein